MQERLCRRDAIHVALRRLEQYTSLSPFSRVFYRFIYDHLCAPGAKADRLEQAFHLFLRSECRRHQSVCIIVHSGRVDLVEIARVGRSVHDRLNRLCRAIERLEFAGVREATVRELLLAECSYHLGHTDKVIRALKRAISLGCRHPLVHFALGYNLYASALKRAGGTRRDARRQSTLDRVAFDALCRRAIAAFSEGLGDAAFDAEIHWWIGQILEMLNERDNARLAYQRAMAADPESFGERVLKKLESFDKQRPLRRSDSEQRRLASLAPITDEEMRQAKRVLDGCKSFPGFLLDAEDA